MVNWKKVNYIFLTLTVNGANFRRNVTIDFNGVKFWKVANG
jgi:hypothetical protein